MCPALGYWQGSGTNAHSPVLGPGALVRLRNPRTQSVAMPTAEAGLGDSGIWQIAHPQSSSKAQESSQSAASSAWGCWQGSGILTQSSTHLPAPENRYGLRSNAHDSMPSSSFPLRLGHPQPLQPAQPQERPQKASQPRGLGAAWARWEAVLRLFLVQQQGWELLAHISAAGPGEPAWHRTTADSLAMNPLVPAGLEKPHLPPAPFQPETTKEAWGHLHTAAR